MKKILTILAILATISYAQKIVSRVENDAIFIKVTVTKSYIDDMHFVVCDNYSDSEDACAEVNVVDVDFENSIDFYSKNAEKSVKKYFYRKAVKIDTINYVKIVISDGYIHYSFTNSTEGQDIIPRIPFYTIIDGERFDIGSIWIGENESMDIHMDFKSLKKFKLYSDGIDETIVTGKIKKLRVTKTHFKCKDSSAEFVIFNHKMFCN